MSAASRTPARSTDTRQPVSPAKGLRCQSPGRGHGQAGPQEREWLLPERHCTLFGTAVWDRLSPQQRLDLRGYETAHVVATRAWMAGRLAQMTGRPWRVCDRPGPAGLDTFAGEQRPSGSLWRAVATAGTPDHRRARRLGGLGTVAIEGPAAWGAVLLGYELTSNYLNSQVARSSVPAGAAAPAVTAPAQPGQAELCGIARAELVRAVAKVSPGEMYRQRMVLAHAAFMLSGSLVTGEAYRGAGVDVGQAVCAAVANPYHQEAVCLAGERTMAFLHEAGMTGAPGTHWWRRSFLLR
ncbi:MAG TPA: diiron oxygenase [Streptosporangiaceae bacterium]|nr:diiron oxygenase [Streptosporangiaceae bacterium]